MTDDKAQAIVAALGEYVGARIASWTESPNPKEVARTQEALRLALVDVEAPSRPRTKSAARGDSKAPHAGCRWCGDESHRCEQINGSCGWLLVAAEMWEELSRTYNGHGCVISFETSTKEYVRQAYARSVRLTFERHRDLANAMSATGPAAPTESR